jgi:DNA-binding NarL/FixJ family response regulator
MTLPIRILVADDHPIVRDGLVAILGTQPDLHVVGEVGDGVELVAQAGSLQPDVVLTDLEMPGLDGVAAIQQVRQVSPTTRVVVLTAYDTDERIIGALRAGAQGYLLKGVPRQEIFAAIRAVAAGGTLLQQPVAARLLRRADGQPAANESLTPRELEVLQLLRQGRTNKAIAATLNISERTVKFHVSALLGKLGAGNRTEAVRRAIEQGMIDP